MNLYEKAIFEVGMVIEPLTADKKFTMFGFGGFPEYLSNFDELEQKKLLRCWNLIREPTPSDSDEYQPEERVQGLVGMLGAYH
jgi:hypothetical protein